MATTTTTTDLTPEYFAFSGLPPLESLENSPFPRGYTVFEDSSVAITVAGAGEDQIWRIEADLPIGYAYVLVEAHVQLQGAIADLAGWDTAMGGEIVSPGRSIPFDGLASPDSDIMATTALDRRIFSFPDLSTTILIAEDTTATMILRIGNHTTDDGAMTGSVFIKFMTYDIEQAHHFQIHTPQLVR